MINIKGDLMIQSDRYLTDKEKEHYTPHVPITVEPDATLTHAKNLIRDFCLEELLLFRIEEILLL